MKAQCQNYLQKVADANGFSTEQLAEAEKLLTQHVAAMDIPVAPKRTRTTKTVEPEDRCMARVWGGGSGNQCKGPKCDGSDYCKRCAKAAAVTEEPLTFDENGKHIGLFWGRFDQDLPHFKDGHVCVQWKSDESKAIVAAALKEGKTFHPFSGESKKKNRKSTGTKKPRKGKKATKKNIAAGVKRAKNAYMFFLDAKRPEIRAEVLAESGDDTKTPPVAEVARKAGARWRLLTDAEKAPYNELASAAKLARQAQIDKLLEEASNASETASIDDVSIQSDEESALVIDAKPAKSAKAAVPDEVVDNEVTQLAFAGIDNDNTQDDEESIVSAVTDATGLEELDEEDDEDTEEVEEQVLANGKKVLKGSDGTLYDPENFEELGKWDESTNALIIA